MDAENEHCVWERGTIVDELQQLKKNAAAREFEIARLSSENVSVKEKLREAEARFDKNTKRKYEQFIGHKVKSETEKMEL